MVTRTVPDRFGAAYGPGGAPRLTIRMNSSAKMARPVPYNTASPEEIDAYIGNTIKAIRRHADLDYSVICLDAAGLADSPSRRWASAPGAGAIRSASTFPPRRLGSSGALGAKTLDIRFHEKADAPALISLLEYVRRKRGQDIRDTGRRRSPTGQRRWTSTIGTRAAVWSCGSRPPRTPRHNQIGVLWREIRRAIADICFGGIGRMRTAIIRMPRRGEVAIISSLFRYVLEAMDCRNPVPGACAA